MSRNLRYTAEKVHGKDYVKMQIFVESQKA
jgi:hypothetical protein